MFELTYTVEFHASHLLPEYNGPCSRCHGHNWIADIECKAETLNDHGMVADFDVLKKSVPDHHHLNDWMQAPPTTENVAAEIFHRLKNQGVPVVAVTVWETARGRVRYTG